MRDKTFQRLLMVAGLLCLLIQAPVHAQDSTSAGSNTIRVFTIDGAIGPATSDYIQRGIEDAEADGAYMVIIAMDTPGGLDLSMRDIIQTILDSDIPVVSYVFPQGARAASAGT